jgi:ribosomal protein L11 methyltransferase
MTNHCLTIGPCPRELARACAAVLESRDEPSLLSLSVSEADDKGLCWQVDAHYGSAHEVMAAAMLALSQGATAKLIGIAVLDGTDWVRRSLEGLPPVRAGRFFVHGSHDRALRPYNTVSIEIDAGMAFGTGHHATTRGCLLALDHVLKRRSPRRILDVGCGSGILAIAASRARHRTVAACDIDAEAVRVTMRNARLNGASIFAVHVRDVSQRSIGLRGPYDLIMANILARPLKELARDFDRLAAGDCALILSGLLSEQRRTLESLYRLFGFVGQRTWELEGWITLLLRRQKKRSPGVAR